MNAGIEAQGDEWGELRVDSAVDVKAAMSHYAVVGLADVLCAQLTAIDEAVVDLCRMASNVIGDRVSVVLQSANRDVNRATDSLDRLSVLLHRVTSIPYDDDDE